MDITRSKKRPQPPPPDRLPILTTRAPEPSNHGERCLSPMERASDCLEDKEDLKPRKRRKAFQGVYPAPAAFPQSAFYDPGSTRTSATPEREALFQLRDAWLELQASFGNASFEYIMLTLSDFTIYQPAKISCKGLDRSLEMEALHYLHCKYRTDELLFDGTVTCGALKVRLEGVPFSKLAIDGYGDPGKSSVADSVSIQSNAASTIDTRIWYVLREPSARYDRYHDAFLWIADLGKHFIDYVSENDRASLFYFRERFRTWLLRRYGKSRMLGYRSWLAKAGSKDFRSAILANWDYLWNQHYQLDGATIRKLPVWQEIYAGDLTAIPKQSLVESRTVVTPYVFDCFKELYFENELKSVSMHEKVAYKHKHHKESLGFPETTVSTNAAVDSVAQLARDRARLPCTIRAGDVVAVARDVDTAWTDTSALWFAYVQGVGQDNHWAHRFLHVIWLYRPEDTTLAGAKYPRANELFFSDNCNCGDSKVTENEVVCVLDVDWFEKTGVQSQLLVNKKYYTNEQSFKTLKHADFMCHHAMETMANQLRRYTVGDTAYLMTASRLEPIIVVGFDDDFANIIVRRLLRREDIESNAEPNELLWSDRVEQVPAREVVEHCYIRIFKPSEAIPVPYNRKGSGHFWFITSRLLSEVSNSCEPLPEYFSSCMRQGFVPSNEEIQSPLRGLDLFSGGGNFGRGIMEGGAVQMKYAVDFDMNALHTYRANLEAQEDTQLFLGSVDDYLLKSLMGTVGATIAPVGTVDFLCAGSSCRGFSTKQSNKLSSNSRKNASLVASVAAYIDHYRPKYALLENVVSMAHKHKDLVGNNVFSQLLCCLVGMGYQVSQFNIDAWSCGAPQSRGRLFICISAPEMPPIEHPQLTHAHPPGTRNRSLGWTANGESFGDRLFGPTPFGYVSASASTSDLPNIGDARVGTCISYPDHRVPLNSSATTRTMFSMIPTIPEGSSFNSAARMGLMPQPQMDLIKDWKSIGRMSKDSKAWTRLVPTKVYPTITRVLRPTDSFGGSCLHWTQPRMMTLMEARRAQGYPDDEVLIGRVRDQWAIVGDAVCRQVALALGVRLREAWLTAK